MFSYKYTKCKETEELAFELQNYTFLVKHS